MTKSELIERIATQQKQLSPKDVELAVKMIIENMAQSLASGDRIEIRGFGSFSLHYRDRGGAAIRRPATRSTTSASTCPISSLRLVGMKLYQRRATDYLRNSSQNDRRYLLYNPTSKMKVTLQAEELVSLLWDVIAAKGFKKDTYFHMAAADIMGPSKLEGTVHVNPAHPQVHAKLLLQPRRVSAGSSGPFGKR